MNGRSRDVYSRIGPAVCYPCGGDRIFSTLRQLNNHLNSHRELGPRARAEARDQARFDAGWFPTPRVPLATRLVVPGEAE